MPAAGNKRNDWIPPAFHDDEIERITVAGPIGVRCAAVLFCEYRSQGIKVKILDSLAGINILGTNVCAEKWRPRNRQRKVESLQAVLSSNYNVRIFNAGIKDAVHKACCCQMRR